MHAALQGGELALLGKFVPVSTPERRAAALEARRRSLEAGADLRRDFADDLAWQERARSRGMRLPYWHHPCTVPLMHRWLHKLGVTQGEYRKMAGADCEHFIEHNPRWPLRAWAGTVLEMMDESLD